MWTRLGGWVCCDCPPLLCIANTLSFRVDSLGGYPIDKISRQHTQVGTAITDVIRGLKLTAER